MPRIDPLWIIVALGLLWIAVAVLRHFISRRVTCEHCAGRGSIMMGTAYPITCPWCSGKGSVPRVLLPPLPDSEIGKPRAAT